MKQRMYCIYDSAVQAFVSPHFARTHGEAERNFKLAVNDSKNGHLYNSPEQFTLNYIGEYDEASGVVTPLPAPQTVISGAQCKAETPNVSQIGA